MYLGDFVGVIGLCEVDFCVVFVYELRVCEYYVWLCGRMDVWYLW